jgi:hypothetical protein
MNASLQLKHFNPEGLEHIPKELLLLPQAITWQAGKLDLNTGKFSKFPKGKDGTGNNWPKSNQWVGNLIDAIELALKNGHSGPGVVLPAQINGKHLVAFDWDGVDFKDPDRMNEIMQDWKELGEPYMEVSPSGKGLRAFVLSDSPVPDASSARKAGGKDELFCSSKARWMTVTGDVFKSGSLSDATKVALTISQRWKGTKPNTQTVRPIQKRVGKYIEIVQPTSMLQHLLPIDKFIWPKEPLKDGGGRESMMLRYAGHLRSQGFSQAVIDEKCLIANAKHYEEPLDESVVLDRAGRYSEVEGINTNTPESEWLTIKPLPPKYQAAPALDSNLLPKSLSGYVDDCAKRMRIPAEMIASPMLVALGSVFGKKICVQPRGKDTGWIEYPNFWGASILPPAMLKSPSLNAAMKFINELESNAQLHHMKEMGSWESDERVRKIEAKISENKAQSLIKAGDKSGARQYLDKIHAVKPPTRKRFVISDATPEARLEILCENPNGVLLLRDELDGHIAQLRKDGYENARAQELQFFDGHQDYSDDRIKRGSHIAEGPRMALYGNLQPAKVEKYLIDMHKGGSDDGYLQRMLQLAVQPTIEQKFELLDIKPDHLVEQIARNLFQAADSIELQRHPLTRRIKPKVLKFSPQAQEEFDQFLVELENKLRGGAIRNPVIAAHLGKFRGTLPKLALIIALAEDPNTESISLSAYRRAEGLLEFFYQHAKRIYSIVARYEISSAYELLDRIRKGQLPDGFNPRDDIQRKEWQGLRTSGEIEAALGLLEKHGYVKIVEEPTSGRPKRIVRINPEITRQRGTEVVATP